MSTLVQNDFSLQFRDSFFDSFIFVKSGHVCFRIMKTKAGGEGGRGGEREQFTEEKEIVAEIVHSVKKLIFAINV